MNSPTSPDPGLLLTEAGIEVALCSVPSDYAGKSAAVRACAAARLAAHGVTGAVIGRAADGAPLWPAGWVGSLTHATARGAVALARREHVRAVGIDLENPARMHRRLWAHVLAPAELAAVTKVAANNAASEAHAEAAANARAAAVFSAKEAIYKALAPLHSALGLATPGFHDVTLRWAGDADNGTSFPGTDARTRAEGFTIAPGSGSASASPLLAELRGRVWPDGDDLLALAWLPATPNSTS